jgi:hypothetical protein
MGSIRYSDIDDISPRLHVGRILVEFIYLYDCVCISRRLGARLR